MSRSILKTKGQLHRITSKINQLKQKYSAQKYCMSLDSSPIRNRSHSQKQKLLKNIYKCEYTYDNYTLKKRMKLSLGANLLGNDTIIYNNNNSQQLEYNRKCVDKKTDPQIQVNKIEQKKQKRIQKPDNKIKTVPRTQNPRTQNPRTQNLHQNKLQQACQNTKQYLRYNHQQLQRANNKVTQQQCKKYQQLKQANTKIQQNFENISNKVNKLQEILKSLLFPHCQSIQNITQLQILESNKIYTQSNKTYTQNNTNNTNHNKSQQIHQQQQLLINNSDNNLSMSLNKLQQLQQSHHQQIITLKQQLDIDNMLNIIQKQINLRINQRFQIIQKQLHNNYQSQYQYIDHQIKQINQKLSHNSSSSINQKTKSDLNPHKYDIFPGSTVTKYIQQSDNPSQLFQHTKTQYINSQQSEQLSSHNKISISKQQNISILQPQNISDIQKFKKQIFNAINRYSMLVEETITQTQSKIQKLQINYAYLYGRMSTLQYDNANFKDKLNYFHKRTRKNQLINSSHFLASNNINNQYDQKLNPQQPNKNVKISETSKQSLLLGQSSIKIPKKQSLLSQLIRNSCYESQLLDHTD